MNVVVLSAFRNMEGKIAQYFDQVSALREFVSSVRVVAVEGDSTDRTVGELVSEAVRYSIPLSVINHDHGLRAFGSTEAPDRLAALTPVMMAAWGAIEESDDLALYVESDLLWHPAAPIALLDHAEARTDGFDVVSPLVFAGPHFYDVWAFRKNGSRFESHYPFHPELNQTGITEVDSVGSCLAVRAGAVAGVLPDGKQGLVSWCDGARKAGLRIGVDVESRIYHPLPGGGGLPPC